MNATITPATTLVKTAELTIGERLEELRDEFMADSFKLHGLRYAIFLYPDALDLSKKQANAWLCRLEQDDPGGPHEWEPLPLNNTLGRAWHESGDEAIFRAAFRRYADLGTRAFRLFTEIDDDLPEDDADRGFLHMLWEMSFECPTAFVCQESGIWGRGTAIAEDDFYRLIEERMQVKGMDLPAHSLYATFGHDLFFVSATAIEMFLRPHIFRFMDECPELPWLLQALLANRSILSLTASEICDSTLRENIVDLNYVASERTSRPRWDGVWLTYRGNIVKKPNSRATELIPILDALEAAGWPSFPVTSPFVTKGPAYLRRDPDRERTRKALNKLNQSQHGPYRIIFGSKENGEKVVWKVRSGF